MHGNLEMIKTNQTSATSDNSGNHWSGRFSVAPMLDWTDRHCRYFLRQLSRHTLLYTEMVTTGAIIHGKGDYLAYSKEEHPVALQLGGSDPAALAQCAKLAESRGYDEINLNVGCPSDRVQNGMFGACLMGNAQLVADCIKAMRDVVSIPVTVKTRIGIDDQTAMNSCAILSIRFPGKANARCLSSTRVKPGFLVLAQKRTVKFRRWTILVCIS